MHTATGTNTNGPGFILMTFGAVQIRKPVLVRTSSPVTGSDLQTSLLGARTISRAGDNREKNLQAVMGKKFRISISETITLLFLCFCLSNFPSISLAYRPGEIVPMSKMGQYHSTRTVWHDMIGRQCPMFGVNREVLVPLAKPQGYTGTDPYKISFQVGREKFLIPWLLVINRKGPEVPMIEVNLRYSGNDLHGVTAKVVDMPHHYVEIHPNIRTQFWDPQHWPKHVLVRYTWEERSEIDVGTGFYVLFGSGLVMSFILAIYVLQSSQDKLARFVKETVVESSMPGVGMAKVE